MTQPSSKRLLTYEEALKSEPIPPIGSSIGQMQLKHQVKWDGMTPEFYLMDSVIGQIKAAIIPSALPSHCEMIEHDSWWDVSEKAYRYILKAIQADDDTIEGHERLNKVFDEVDHIYETLEKANVKPIQPFDIIIDGLPPLETSTDFALYVEYLDYAANFEQAIADSPLMNEFTKLNNSDIHSVNVTYTQEGYRECNKRLKQRQDPDDLQEAQDIKFLMPRKYIESITFTLKPMQSFEEFKNDDID